MAWLAGALEIIKAIPTLISVVKLVWDAYKEMKEDIERNRKNSEAKKAIEEMDRKKLEEMLGKK